jgi:hypothetical protein
MSKSVLALLTLLTFAMASLASTAAATPPRPTDLQVGGNRTWSADNRFELKWIIPPATTLPLVATHYRIRNPQGEEIEWQRLPWPRDGLASLTVPKVSGTYGVEVWFEDSSGDEGPAASAQLRFDDVRPGPTEPRPVPGWLSRTAFPARLHLGHPVGPVPISGIRGYAVTIGTAPFATPCLATDRCSESEIALRSETGSDVLRLPTLPEGISYLHAVAVSGSGMKSPTSGRVTLRVDTTDPVTRLSGLEAGWTNRGVRLVASATDSASGMGRGGEGRPFTAIRIDGGQPAVAPGGSVSTSVIAEGVHRISYYARDAAGNIDDGGHINGIANHEPRTATVRIDRTPPSLAFANSQDPFDPELLRVRIGDPLAGPDPARGQIGIRLAGSGDRFAQLAPAPAPNGELRVRWNSDAYPAGNYEFRAIGYDAAGNRTITTRSRNGEPMILSNPLKSTTSLRVGFHRQGVRRTVPYGHSVLLSGRLTAGRGAPLRDREVKLVERFAGGARPSTRISTLTTGPGGQFSIRTTTGPSRTISTTFGGTPTLSRASAPTLALRVRSRVQLRVSASVARVGGPPLVFRGRLVAPAKTIPPSGRPVQLQFRLPGLPWAEFRTVQTDAEGRFRYGYRFSDDDSRGVRFQFRAFAAAHENWPYEPAGSRPILVRGR